VMIDGKGKRGTRIRTSGEQRKKLSEEWRVRGKRNLFLVMCGICFSTCVVRGRRDLEY
jgi:hypothetical protein